MLREFLLKIIAIVGQIVLVRLLAPEHFGIYAVAILFVALAEFLTDFGIVPIIIQSKKPLSRLQTSTLFYMREALVVLIILLVLLSWGSLVEIFGSLKGNGLIVVVLISTLFFKPIKSIANAHLDRYLQFKAVGFIDGVGVTTYYACAIILAFNGEGIWSLVWGLVAKEITESMLAVRLSSWSPHLEFSLRSVKKYFRFGFFLKVGDGVLLIHNSLIPLFGGIFYSSSQVGYLVWSRSIISIPNSILDNFGRVALTGMSRIQDEVLLLSKSVEHSIKALNVLLFLFFILLFPFAYEFIDYIATDKWLPAVAALKIILCSLLFSGTTIPIAHAVIAVGRAKEITVIAAIILAFEIIIMFSMSSIFGYLAIAIAIVAASLLQFLTYHWYARKININIRLGRHYFVFSIIIFSLLLVTSVLNDLFPSGLIYYIAKLILTVFLYLLCVALLSKKEYIDLLNLIKRNIIGNKKIMSSS